MTRFEEFLAAVTSSKATSIAVGLVTILVLASLVAVGCEMMGRQSDPSVSQWLDSGLVRFGITAFLALWMVPLAIGRWQVLTAQRVKNEPERRLRASSSPGGETNEYVILGEADPQSLAQLTRELTSMAQEEDAVIVPLLDRTMSQAIALHASDVHFEPGTLDVRVRLRIDGTLVEVARLPRTLHTGVINRLKVMSNLPHFERAVPQDGRIFAELRGQSYDIRSSFLPTIHGEKAALRIFETGGQRFELGELGFTKRILSAYQDLLSRPQGIAFVTGPTGSGKTTTMYASLRHIKSSSSGMVNIATLEDPVEYALPDFSQTQVHEGAGLTFAKGLRTVLRQDPDVIMIGEIRDLETAQVALQAGLTGHLMLTTVHADSTAGVFSRLVNMGCEPFLLASASLSVLSQRLVRTLCPDCRRPTPTTDRQRLLLQHAGLDFSDEAIFYTGEGCRKCFGSGYRGRSPLAELLAIDEGIKEAIIAKRPTGEVERIAVQTGMRTLFEDGITKALAGTTSLAEVFRVTR